MIERAQVRRTFLLTLLLTLVSLLHHPLMVDGQSSTPTPIYDIQRESADYVGATVTVEGVVSGVFGELFFLQDPAGGPWSGIAIYSPGHDTVAGDRLTIQGHVTEFHDLTQIEPLSIETRGGGSPPVPATVSAQEAKNEAWEGVLVQIDELVVREEPDQFGEWRIEDESGLIIVDDRGHFYAATPGESIVRIVAIVDHAFGNYRLIPRSAADIVSAAEAPDLPPLDDIVPIYEIQGNQIASPYDGTRVDTLGRISAVEQNGFYLQDPQGDGDSSTSDGIYVYLGRRPQWSAGECIFVSAGLVDEYFEKTELTRPEEIRPVDACSPGGIEAAPIPLAAFNQDPVALFEAFEGMLVSLPPFEGLIQAPTKRFNNGDVELGVAPGHIVPYLPGGRVYWGQSGDQAGLLFLTSALGAQLPDAAWGDRIDVHSATEGEPVRAVLDYNFGKYQLHLLPDQPLEVEPVAREPDLPGESDDEFIEVCSLNVHGLGRGTDQYRDEERYALELERRATLVGESLAGCALIGIQETGQPEDAQNLAEAIEASYGISYTAVAIEGPNSRSLEFPLTSSLLARNNRVRILDAELRQGCSPASYGVAYMAGSCSRGSYALFNRPPLVVEVEVLSHEGDPVRMTLIVNHWKSKGGDEEVNLPRRILQAEHVAAIVQEELDTDPDALVVVLGDLNDTPESEPVRALKEGTNPSLLHTLDVLPPLDRYTFNFNGVSQVLDHILITPAMRNMLAGLDIVHISSDYPIAEGGGRLTPFGATDHDPVRLLLRPEGAGWIGGNVGVGGVRITLLDMEGTMVTQSVTDPGGDFRLWGLSPGRYRLIYVPPEGVSLSESLRMIQLEAGAGLWLEPGLTHRWANLGFAAVGLSAGVGIPSSSCGDDIVSCIPLTP